jgi:hypothetical protein
LKQNIEFIIIITLSVENKQVEISQEGGFDPRISRLLDSNSKYNHVVLKLAKLVLLVAVVLLIINIVGFVSTILIGLTAC